MVAPGGKGLKARGIDTCEWVVAVQPVSVSVRQCPSVSV